MSTILVIDDSRTQALLLEKQLKRWNFTVEVATSAEAGLAAIERATPDLVISDVVMPGMDGFALCKHLRAAERTRALRIMLMTSLHDTADVLRALESGADNFITKPYQPETLHARIQRMLEGTGGCEAVEFRGVRYQLDTARAHAIELLVSSLEALSERNAAVEQSHAAAEKALDDMSRAVASRDEVLAVVSHDLRNPLGNVVMAAKMVANDVARLQPAGSEAMLKRLAMISRAAETMTRLISNLLDASRIDAGALSLECTPHPLAAMIDEAVLSQAALAESRKIELLVRGPRAPLTVMVDRERMLQVLANLLSNAIKFSPDGAKITVESGANADGVTAHVAVQDAGKGIAPEFHQRVFERFWQSKETAKQGTGLGLPIVKGIVEAHGGRVWVESAIGAGARFAFTVPLASA